MYRYPENQKKWNGQDQFIERLIGIQKTLRQKNRINKKKNAIIKYKENTINLQKDILAHRLA